MSQSWLNEPIKGILLDISGVLRDGDQAISGSLEAFKRLKSSSIPVRLVTNETQVTLQTTVEKLTRLGYTDVEQKDVFAPAPAMVTILKRDCLRPYLLIHPKLLPEFTDVDKTNPNCVVLGDAAEYFTYDAMNTAFRTLLKLKECGSPKFFALGKGRYYKEDADLNLDVGPFVAALEYSTDIKAELIGKPSNVFFQTALNDLGLRSNEVVMIGDDIVGDVGGAQSAGLRGILVRTGKFRPSDESHPFVTPDGIVNNLAAAADLILGVNI